MPANTNPIFILTPNNALARTTAANTASDGTGTLVSLVTSGSNGTRVDAVRFRNSEPGLTASSAMVHRIFLTDNSSQYKLIGEIATPSGAKSASAIGATSIYVFDQPIIMKSGSTMSVAQSVYAGQQDQFDVQAFAGDY
jgi:hypothetical protein